MFRKGDGVMLHVLSLCCYWGKTQVETTLTHAAVHLGCWKNSTTLNYFQIASFCYEEELNEA